MMKILKLIKLFYWRYLKSPLEYAQHVGVHMGKDCFISTRNFPSEGFLIEIGDYVRIASGVSFYTHGGIWTLRKAYNNPKLDYFGKIKIGSYTHIGEDAKIMPGVTIGSKCIVGAGTVVTKSVPDGCMVAGNPCKFIGFTDDFYQRMKKQSVETGEVSGREKEQILLSFDDSSFTQKKYIIIPERK